MGGRYAFPSACLGGVRRAGRGTAGGEDRNTRRKRCLFRLYVSLIPPFRCSRWGYPWRSLAVIGLPWHTHTKKWKRRVQCLVRSCCRLLCVALAPATRLRLCLDNKFKCRHTLADHVVEGEEDKVLAKCLRLKQGSPLVSEPPLTSADGLEVSPMSAEACMLAASSRARHA